jgi:hypothetical protein
MLQRMRSLRLASIVGCLLVFGSIGFAAQRHTTYPVAKAKAAPKKSGGKPAPHKPAPKPKAPDAHKQGTGKQTGSKPENKKKGAGTDEHKNALASKEHGNAKEADPKHEGKEKKAGEEERKKKLASAADEHHKDIHHPDHKELNTVENVTVNKTVAGGAAGGGTVASGPGAAGTGGDAGAAPDAMPNVGGSSLPGRPQMLFSFNEVERDRYDRAAQKVNMKRDDWIRARLDEAAGR